MSADEQARMELADLRDAQVERALRNPKGALFQAIRHLNHANMRMMSEVLELLRAGKVPRATAMQAAEVLAANSARIAEAAEAYNRFVSMSETID